MFILIEKHRLFSNIPFLYIIFTSDIKTIYKILLYFPHYILCDRWKRLEQIPRIDFVQMYDEI